jgi:hypothetical protein
MRTSDLPVYMEFIDLIASGTTPEDIVNFRPSQEAQQRLSELLQRNSEGRITTEEAEELEEFMLYERMATLAKAKARLVLANRQ